jgi:CheY-like chemotaxis protein
MKTTNVYIADDDTDDIEFFQAGLEDIDSSLSLTYGKNGMELLRKLLYPQLPVPDLIFLDINMPLMNGIECLREIKSHLHLKDIPIIIYSTTALNETVETAYELGANMYVEKPSDYTKLVNMLSSVMKIDWMNYSKPDISHFVYRAS